MTINKKVIIFIISLLAALILGVVVFQYIQRIDKKPFVIHSIPSDASIEINGSFYKSGRTIYLEEGEYDYKSSRAGFVDESGQFYVSDQLESLFIQQSPDSQEGHEWLESNSRHILKFEELAGSDAQKKGVLVHEKYPIMKDLPIRNPIFTIGYKNDPSDKSGMSIIITIDAEEHFRQNAINYLIDQGYNVGDYKFEFYNEENPFNEQN